jgi:methylmalonyl-CoA decarboxylase subunit alpha
MDKIEELWQKKELAYLAGGEKMLQMQQNLNKMNARQRVKFILDEGSFVEIGALIGANGAGVVTGYGTIDGRLIYIYSEDYTVDGGMISARNSKKICSIMNMALEMGAPLVQVIDSSGAKLEEGLDVLNSYSSIISMNAKLSGVVPQISVIAGPCTGIAAISAAMSDITIIAEDCGALYVSSPNTIQQNKLKYVENSSYADAGATAKSGSAQITVANDKEALLTAKKIIQYLPSNNIEFSPAEENNYGKFISPSLDEAVNNGLINIREIINSIADEGSVIELNRYRTEEVITLFIRINGFTAGVIANDRKFNGDKLTIKACEKLTSFVKLCDSFNISIISLVDCKGYTADAAEEQNGLAVAGAKLVYSLAEANVPKLSLIIGDAYGAGFICLASKATAFDLSFAWPGTTISITDPETAVKVLYKEEIKSSDIPEKAEKELLKEYLEGASAYKAAESGYIDDIIVPSETKLRLYSAFDMLQSKRVIKYPKKHGSILI